MDIIKRDFDIVVFGCTGNAGRAVALHLIRGLAKGNERVALAGRNKKKIENLLSSVQAELQAEGRDDVRKAKELGIIVADATDPKSMVNMTRAASICISCAGPFGRYGEAAVAACVQTKTHYVDITGEVPWVGRMRNKYGQKAKDADITLLPFSGYDCVPAELAMFLGSRAIQQKGKTMRTLELVFQGKKGGFPHGTVETMIDGVEQRLSRKKTPRESRGESYVPSGSYKAALRRSIGISHWIFPRWSAGRFTAPNFMSAINVPVLQRAAHNLGIDSIDVSDRIAVGPKGALSIFGLLPVLIFQIVLFLGGLLLVTPCFRWWLRRRLKTYSFAGNPNGSVKVWATARSSDGATEAKVRMFIKGDAGIYATGLLAAAVARALLKANRSSQDVRPDRGFSTPCIALRRGDMLLRELRDSGVAVEMPSTSPEEPQKKSD